MMNTNEFNLSSTNSDLTSEQHPAHKKDKIVIIIDKNYFCLCKRFFLEGEMEIALNERFFVDLRRSGSDLLSGLLKTIHDLLKSFSIKLFY